MSSRAPGVIPDTSSRRTRTRVRSLPQRVRNFTIISWSVGAMLFCANLVLTRLDSNLELSRFLITLFLFVGVAVVPGHRVARGNEYRVYHFWEYPAIVGIVLTEPYVVVVAMTLAVIGLQTRMWVTRPEERAALPARFGMISISISLGAYVAVIAPPWSLALGFIFGSIVFELMMLWYDLTKGDRDYAVRTFREGLGLRLAAPVTISTAVTVMVVLVGPQRWFLLLSPIVLLFAYWLIGWRSNIVHEQAGWKRMEAISSSLIDEHDETAVIRIALDQSLELFAATRCTIVLPPANTLMAGSMWSLRKGPGEQVAVMYGEEGKSLPIPDPSPDSNHVQINLGLDENLYGVMLIEWSKEAPELKARSNLERTFGNAVAASIRNSWQHTHIAREAAQKAREAEQDPLTKLGNRSMLAERGPSLLAESADRGHCALLLLDLDGFKRVNDTLGHAAGDEVLIEVARRLARTSRSNDLVIRLGGDEFAILFSDIEQSVDAAFLASKVARSFVDPVRVEGLSLSVESSIGIALYPDDAETIEDLLKAADIAMYKAKREGRGKTQQYKDDIKYETTEDMQLTTDLRRAMHSAELTLHYQPQVSLADDKITGVEGLVRWNHPELGMLSPDRFVRIAEKSNLIRLFTLTIIEKALQDRVEMRAYMPEATVSVNLSAQNLLDAGLPTDVERLLKKYQVSASELVLEVTETTTAADARAAERVLTGLARLGIKIAMDDFGSGYATMEAMRVQGPVQEVKIDRGFITNINKLPRDQIVARAIIAIISAYGCDVVAEGVAEEEQYELLRDMDCQYAQGFFISKPLPLSMLRQWVLDPSHRWSALPSRVSGDVVTPAVSGSVAE